MRRLTAGVTAVLAGALLAGCGSAPGPATAPGSATTRRMTAYLDGAVGREEFRGSVQVRLGDQVLLNRGFGDAADGEPNGPDTRFRIGAVTKEFTALAVLTLQERTKLRVTDPVCDYLPDCPPAWRAITLNQLLTHTSGLYDYAVLDAGELGSRRPSPEQLTALFAGRPLEFAPGTRYAYGDSGYVLLGRVIEHVSGQTYGQYLRSAILDPLGMNDTGYQPGLATPGGYAMGHRDWRTTAATPDDSVGYAAGGLRSTVRDLARWNDFLLTNTPAMIGPETHAELLRARVETTPTEQYGFGIQSRAADGGPAYFHAGSVAGFTSYDEVQPASRVSVTVLANLGTVDAVDVGRRLAAMAAQ